MENSLRLRRFKKSLMLDIIGDGINTVEFNAFLASIKRVKDFQKLYVNIANLYDIDNDTLNKFRKMHAVLRDKHVCFINVSAINNSILNLFEIDKLFQIYLSKYDAIEGKRPVINRKFKLVS